MSRRPTGMSLAPALGKALLFVLTTAVLFLSPFLASAAESPKRVLIFASEEQQGPGVFLVNQSIRSTLRNGRPAAFLFFYEALDSFRISTEKYEEELVRLLQRKYDGERFDLIYPVGTPALRFLLKHRGELFTDTPLIYVVVDQRQAANLDLGPNVTGVGGKMELAPTLDIALTLQPQTQRVVVVAGNASADNTYVALARQEFRPYEGKVEFTYLINLPIEELQTRLAGLPEKSVVFYLSVNSDPTTRIYTSPEVLARLAPSSSVPIYAASQIYIGNGTIGGRLLNLEEIGTRAAEIGLRILAGESAQSIPPQTIPSVDMFDWRELRRWKIDEAKLPAGSIVRYRQFTAWELYKWRIIGAMTLIALQALGIIWLLFTQAKRRQAEQENARLARLAEAERMHLDEVVSNVPGIVWEALSEPGTDRRTTTLVSEHVEKMLGYSVDEWLSTPGFAMTIVLEEDRERAMRETQALFEGGKDGVLEFRWRTKDGRIVWVESQVAVIHDEAGRAVGLRGVTMDVTDRKVAEAGLKQSEAQLAGVVGSAMDGIISVDESQNVVLFNTAAEKMFGCSAREAIGQPLDRFVPERFRAAHKDHIRAFGRQGVTTRSMGSVLPIVGRKATGEDFPIEASISRIELNGQNFYTVILRDITERLHAEEALRQSEHLFRNMADTAPVLIWMSGPDKLRTYFNLGWLEFTGRTMDQELGNGWAEGVYGEDYARCLEIYNSSFDRRDPFEMEYRLRCADGVFRWIYDVGTPRFSSDGEFLGYIGSCIDISERKRAEMEMEQQRSELAHLSRVTMLGELSGSMAHELNQPLTAILSNAQAAQRFLAHDDVDLDEVRDILGDIVKQDKRAGEVIHRLRLLLKKSTVEHQPLDLNDVVSEVLKLVRNDLLNQRVTGQMELAPELPVIVGDRVQLQQVVLNLVMNGCDSIASGTSGDRKLIIRTELNNGEGICVSVADQGVGLAGDNLEKVFEPFFSTKPHGMGLGLSVCRTIIAAHGGKLWAANNAERGATFYFSIPTQPEVRS